jgi:osmoprotectant transport system ATP-binding protein
MEADARAIEIRDAWKSYDGGASFALKGVTLDVARGEFLVLVGASGSGKTTLLKLINRLAEPTRGLVAVDGKSVAGGDPALLRRRVGYVFQGVGLFPHMNVAENVAVTLRLLRWERPAIDARVGELLELVRLPRELAARMPGSLSGGQAQRVGVARALAAKPAIMLMDEPFGAVDPITRDALAQDYRALHEALGLTTVMVTHDVLEAVLLADRIAVMENGELVETGTTQELLSHAERPSVRTLMDMPRRQAMRVAALTANPPGPRQ